MKIFVAFVFPTLTLSAMVNLKTVQKDELFTVTVKPNKEGKAWSVIALNAELKHSVSLADNRQVFTFVAAKKGYPLIQKGKRGSEGGVLRIISNCVWEYFTVDVVDDKTPHEKIDYDREQEFQEGEELWPIERSETES